MTLQTFPAASVSRLMCSACSRDIEPGSTYRLADITDGYGTARHLGECERFIKGTAADLRQGDRLYSHRYTLTDWGPRIFGEVVHVTDERDEKGWRFLWLAPADPTDQTPVERLRALGQREGEEWAARLADKVGTVDPNPMRIAFADDELVFYLRG